MKENIVNQFQKMVIAGISEYKYIDENKIDEMIKNVSILPIFKILNKDDIKSIRNDIHASFKIKLDMGVGLIEKKHVKWFKSQKVNFDMKYWDRYKQYLAQDKGFGVKVVDTMDEVSDELVDLLGDPNINSMFQRRGLIIGDVQSGKTANYTGLICKAADAGYKVIVLLTGTIEKLRKQTQARLDEGFVGRDSSAMMNKKPNVYIGVSNYDNSVYPSVLTSIDNDFITKKANDLGFKLDSFNGQVLFVVKKNVLILKKLNQWLKLFNLENNNKINNSLLMIDDEADNASINTKKKAENPTAINAQIVEMLNIFTKASYAGFTATPFANIYIDPETDEEMEKENLFPKDYIYALSAPSNYIGARDIFNEESKYYKMLQLINDCEEFIPIRHKKNNIIYDIPKSLKCAIDQFLICNVIRDLRGDINSHRSMIVNVSRFVNIQQQVGSLVNDYLKNIQASLKLYSRLNRNDALKDKYISSIYKTYLSSYNDINIKWDTIQENLFKSVSPIQTIIVNGKSYGELKYEENKKYGLRAIVVGGQSLSRGLTLEGLIISYFYRNSRMYDTLMQMGRWFGYRKGYDDLCKIWMDENNIEWYKEISESTDELLTSVKKMKDIGATPLDFGLKVRNNVNTLMVTARNKMRTASRVNKVVSLSGEVLEIPKLYNDAKKNKDNLKVIKGLIKAIKEEKIEIIQEGKKYGYKNIDKEIIIDLLKNYQVPISNIKFDNEALIKFIRNYKGNELEKWDVVFLNGSSKSTYLIEDKRINKVSRKFHLINDDNIIQISKQRNRLGSLADAQFGLSKDQINILEKVFKNKNKENDKKNMSQKFHFSEYIKRNPLLMVYVLDIKNNDNSNKYKDKLDKELLNQNNDLVSISIGIPYLSNEETKYAEYQINLVELKKYSEYSNEEEDYE